MKLLSTLAYLLVCLASVTVLWVRFHAPASSTVVNYYPDGTVMQIRNLDSDGLLHGECRIYHPTGRLKSLAEFHHDSMVSAKHYEESGKLLSETTEGPNYEGGTKVYIDR